MKSFKNVCQFLIGKVQTYNPNKSQNEITYCCIVIKPIRIKSHISKCKFSSCPSSKKSPIHCNVPNVAIDCRNNLKNDSNIPVFARQKRKYKTNNNCNYWRKIFSSIYKVWKPSFLIIKFSNTLPKSKIIRKNWENIACVYIPPTIIRVLIHIESPTEETYWLRNIK